jgi:hypothetical protein
MGELVGRYLEGQIDSDEFKCCTKWNTWFGSCCCMNKNGQKGPFKRALSSHDGGCKRGWMC